MRVCVVLCNGKRGAREKFIEKHDLHDTIVSAEAVHALRYKMKQGAFAVIDGFDPARHSDEIDALRRKYLYKIIFLDLESGDLEPPAAPLSDCKIHQKSKIGKGVNLKTWLDGRIFPIRALTKKYESVYHIGDIQGCYAPLHKFLRDHFNDRGYYIFHGDFLDRGPENDRVFKLLYEDLMRRENVLLLWGNHESELIRWANGRPLKISDFKDKTLPQLSRAGITPAMAYDLCRNLRDIFLHAHKGVNIVCSHGGLLDVPRRVVTIDSTLVRGERTKDLREAFDNGPVVMHRSFNGAARGSGGWIQVHGHTNAERHEMCAMVGTVLLNDYPECGEYLRVWRLRRDGGLDGVPIKIKSELPVGFKYRAAA